MMDTTMSTLSAERFEDHYPLLPSPVVIRPYHIEFELKNAQCGLGLNLYTQESSFSSSNWIFMGVGALIGLVLLLAAGI